MARPKSRLNVRYYLDRDTGEPHIYGHVVTEEEVEYVLRHPAEDLTAGEGARAALGATANGRYLRIVYVADSEPNSVFVITAYELRGKLLRAFRRRKRRKGRQ